MPESMTKAHPETQTGNPTVSGTAQGGAAAPSAPPVFILPPIPKNFTWRQKVMVFGYAAWQVFKLSRFGR